MNSYSYFERATWSPAAPTAVWASLLQKAQNKITSEVGIKTLAWPGMKVGIKYVLVYSIISNMY